MADRWVTDKVTDTNSPFLLRRDVLDEIEQPATTANGTLTFNQFIDEVGVSPNWRNPSYTKTINYVSLEVVTGPVGSSYSVNLMRNGVTFITLQIEDGSSSGDAAVVDEDVFAGDLLSVETTSIGTTTPATGGVVQMDYVGA
jgi:hypothetical protein